MHATKDLEEIRIRFLAESLDCICEEDLALLANAKLSTIDAWRKRGLGPSYILFGNRYLYPRKLVANHLETLVRRRGSSAKDLL